MMVRRNSKGLNGLFYGIIVCVLLGLSSCKATRMATRPGAATKTMSTVKLIRNIENNAFDYKYLSIKRINCQFDNGRMSASFKASIYAEKDQQITLLITKLNFPMARLWLTPDSVKFINYLENSYFLDDYSYLSSQLNMNLDFEMVHAIISNNVFSLSNQKNEPEQHYESTVENNHYVIRSLKNNPSSEGRPARRMKQGQEQGAVLQTMVVDPASYKINQLTLEDVQNARKLNVDFADFTPVGKQLYPGEILLSLISPDSNMEMKIKLANFSLNKEKAVRFKVPEKFTRKGHE